MALRLQDIARASSVPAPDRVYAYVLRLLDLSSSSCSSHPHQHTNVVILSVNIRVHSPLRHPQLARIPR